MTESILKVQIVGYYTLPIAEPKNCTVCGLADWGDVLIEGICGRCMRDALQSAGQTLRNLATDELIPGSAALYAISCAATRLAELVK